MSNKFSERLASLLSDKITETENAEAKSRSDTAEAKSRSDTAEAKTSQVDSGCFAKEERGQFSPTVGSSEKDAEAFRRKFAEKPRTGKIVKSYNYIENIPQEIADLLAVLGCEASCTLREVQANFRRKIKEVHPDLKAESQSVLGSINIASEEIGENQNAAQLIAAYEKITRWFAAKSAATQR